MRNSTEIAKEVINCVAQLKGPGSSWTDAVQKAGRIDLNRISSANKKKCRSNTFKALKSRYAGGHGYVLGKVDCGQGHDERTFGPIKEKNRG